MSIDALPAEVMRAIFRAAMTVVTEPFQINDPTKAQAFVLALNRLAYESLQRCATICKAWAKNVADVRWEHYILTGRADGGIDPCDLVRFKTRPDILARVRTLVFVALEPGGMGSGLRALTAAEEFAQACGGLVCLVTWARTDVVGRSHGLSAFSPILPATARRLVCGYGHMLRPHDFARMTQCATLTSLTLTHGALMDAVDHHTIHALVRSLASVRRLHLDFSQSCVDINRLPFGESGSAPACLASVACAFAAGSVTELVLEFADLSTALACLRHGSVALPIRFHRLVHLKVTAQGLPRSCVTKVLATELVTTLPSSLRSIIIDGAARSPDGHGEDVLNTVEAYGVLVRWVMDGVAGGRLPRLDQVGLNRRWAYRFAADDGQTAAWLRQAVGYQETLRAFCVQRGIGMAE